MRTTTIRYPDPRFKKFRPWELQVFAPSPMDADSRYTTARIT